MPPQFRPSGPLAPRPPPVTLVGYGIGSRFTSWSPPGPDLWSLTPGGSWPGDGETRGTVSGRGVRRDSGLSTQVETGDDVTGKTSVDSHPARSSNPSPVFSSVTYV